MIRCPRCLWCHSRCIAWAGCIFPGVTPHILVEHPSGSWPYIHIPLRLHLLRRRFAYYRYEDPQTAKHKIKKQKAYAQHDPQTAEQKIKTKEGLRATSNMEHGTRCILAGTDICNRMHLYSNNSTVSQLHIKLLTNNSRNHFSHDSYHYVHDPHGHLAATWRSNWWWWRIP